MLYRVVRKVFASGRRFSIGLVDTAEAFGDGLPALVEAGDLERYEVDQTSGPGLGPCEAEMPAAPGTDHEPRPKRKGRS